MMPTVALDAQTPRNPSPTAERSPLAWRHEGSHSVVRVREAPLLITVEDVQTGRRFFAADLAQAAERMTRWLEIPALAAKTP